MHVLGIDLGGTKIEAALVTAEGDKIETIRVPTKAEDGPDAVHEQLCRAVAQFDEDSYDGIGLGTPGFYFDGTVGANPNVPKLESVLSRFEKTHDVVIENDANCFALAEHTWGAGSDVDDMVGLIWGTGIGAGLIANGELIRGAVGGAGEVGHMITDFRIGNFCAGCPGTWEYLCSGPNIVRRYREAGGDEALDRPDKILRADDETAREIIDETMTFMGLGMGVLANVLNPACIVVGGGVSNLPIYDQLNQELDDHTITEIGTSCDVVKNELGDTAGVLGAAALRLL
jgi:glucokinase